MNGMQFALVAGFGVLLVILFIGVRGSVRNRSRDTGASGDGGSTTVDSSSPDCGGDGGGGCD